MSRSGVESPLQVLEERNKAILANDMHAFVDLFAEDGVIEMPFTAGELPDRLVGKEAIRAYAIDVDRGGARLDELLVRQTHQTADPEVVIVELTSVGRVTSTGQSFEVPCIQVFRIREGKIVLFRDYVGHAFLPDLS
ncbi:nuclear transport factor 2 family protein [Nocardia spumae]|uniref:nuclear transport factor 2 family protein n=1 Tax=Nocardia spumae TaxID=2887190 RepID=UPI001D141197|nr:nuclear transport factor 2 family protein [Nocardia spumae]